MLGEVVVAVLAAHDVASVLRSLGLLCGKSVEFPVVHSVVLLLLEEELAQFGYIYGVAGDDIVGGGAVGTVALAFKELGETAGEVVSTARAKPDTEARTVAVGDITGTLQTVGELGVELPETTHVAGRA